MECSGFLLVLGLRGLRVHGLGFINPKPAPPKALNPLPPMVHPIAAQGSLHFPAWLFEATLFGGESSRSIPLNLCLGNPNP